MPRALKTAFNAGEISPLLDLRIDSEKSANGCRILENAVPKIYGGVFNRSGMAWMGTAKHADKPCRLIEFIFSASTNFIIEAGEGYMRFWSNGLQVEDPSNPGSPLEIASPYLVGDLRYTQYVQINDVMYLVDGYHPVQKLTRLADDNWTLTNCEWKFPSLKDENITATTLAASAVTGAGITLTASADLFVAGHVGAYFQLTHRRTNANLDFALTATASSSTMPILGVYNVFTYGTWNGTLRLQRQTLSGTWETTRSWTSKGDRNVSVEGSAEEVANYRFDYTATNAGTGSPRVVLELADSRAYGLVKVTAVTNATTATATVVKDLLATTATATWAESAWSDVQGHPRTVTMFEQSLVFGGCAKQPLTVWGSVVGDFENFQRSTFADASYAHVIGSPRGNSIVWLASKDQLLIGTQGDEWLMSGGSEGERLGPTSVNVKRQSAYGGAYVQPVLGNDAVMFVQRGRKKFREFVYVFEKDGYSAPDLTLLAEHIAPGGFKQMCFASAPDPIVWAVTEDHQLLSMTFERDQSVVAWSRHITDGAVESVACIYGSAGEADEVWMSVKRTINGVDVRYIERFDPKRWIKVEANDLPHCIFMDAAKVIEHDEPETVVTGLEHLEGKEVSILADGFVLPRQVVEDGALTLPDPASVVVVGLPFTTRIQPTRLEIPLDDGTSQGRKWKCNKLDVSLWKSLGGEYADSPDSQFYAIQNRHSITPLSAQEPLFTGILELTISGTHRDSIDVCLRNTSPTPFAVLALIPSFQITGS